MIGTILTLIYSLGLSLTDTLDDLINEGRIEPQLAMRILSTFDRVITEVLGEKVRARLTFKVCPSMPAHADNAMDRLHDRRETKKEEEEADTVQGHLDTYRFCDEVWTFLIKDVNFKLDNGATVSADKVKIVSCNSKRPGEA